MTLILASASETRATMLRNAGVAVEVCPSDVDEDVLKQSHRADARAPADLALALAAAKAQDVSARFAGRLVLGADQVLDLDGEMFDKPRDLSDARAQMVRLRGRSHHLVSAAMLVRDRAVVWQGSGTVKLTMRDFSDSFLDAYLMAEGDDVLWTVGGYRIEGRGAQLFERVEGDYFSVLGLPLLDVLDALRNEGVLTA